MNRTTYLTAILGVLSTTLPAQGSAQQQVAMGGEQPRFFVAASPKSPPRAVDAGSVPLLRQQITLEVNAGTLAEALAAITQKTGLAFVYAPDFVRTDARVSFKADRITVAAALTEILLDAGVDVLLTSTGQAALVKRPRLLVGTVSGKVTDRTTSRAIRDATVTLSAAARRTLTGDDGTFRFTGVAAGTHTVTVRHLGYSPESRTITVANDLTATVDFALEPTTSVLERVVVTGTPGLTRIKELGNTIGTIDVEKDLINAPIANVQQLLQGRDAGLISLGGSGTAGAAGTIVLRGFNSLSQSNQPLVYVDGILINTSNSGFAAGAATNRLNDLNMDDVSRVEIIKGPSATTLYGSQASGGVIQIFTKRGSSSGVETTMRAEVGRERMPSTFPYSNPDHSLFSANDLIETGTVQNFNLAVRGSAGPVTYYTSGNYYQNNGSWPQNGLKRAGARANVGVALTDKLTVDLTGQYLWTVTNMPLGGSSAGSVTLINELSDPTKATPANPTGTYQTPLATVLKYKNEEIFNRFVGGISLNQTISPSLYHRLTIGVDAGFGQSLNYFPYGSAPLLPLGSKSYGMGQTVLANVSYAANWITKLSDALKSTFSVGGQLNSVRASAKSLTGSSFSIPGFDAIGGTSTQSVAELRTRYATAGVFGQEALGVGDRLFITGGIRVDGSTSFGENFGTQTYPKLGVSYVISDEKWFHLPAVSSLKLRSAWGKAGKQPGAFDAVRTYRATPVAAGGVGIVATTPGNPDLAPEITGEVEGGFDLGLWDDRVSLQTTLYRQHTDRAIVTLPGAGSNGFTITNSRGALTPAAQLANVGSMENRGVELKANWSVINAPEMRWDLNANFAHNASKVLNLGGGIKTIQVDVFGTVLQPGRPASSKAAQVSNGFDAAGRPTFDGQLLAGLPITYIGPALPPNNGSFGTHFRRGAISISANAQWATGGYITNAIQWAQNLYGTGEQYYAALAANGNSPTAPAVAVLRTAPVGNYVEKSDFLRLREITVSYNLPTTFTGGHPAVFYVSGRNLLTWTKYSGTDPELLYSVAGNGLQLSTDYGNTPQPRTFMVGTSVSLTSGARR